MRDRPRPRSIRAVPRLQPQVSVQVKDAVRVCRDNRQSSTRPTSLSASTWARPPTALVNAPSRSHPMTGFRRALHQLCAHRALRGRSSDGSHRPSASSRRGGLRRLRQDVAAKLRSVATPMKARYRMTASARRSATPPRTRSPSALIAGGEDVEPEDPCPSACVTARSITASPLI